MADVWDRAFKRQEDFEDGLKRRIAELEAENRLVKDNFDRMQRECKHEKIRADKAEAHAADCKRLVTSCENDIDELRLRCRELEAELAALRCCGNCGNIHAYNAGTDDEFKECPYLRENDAEHDYLSIGCHYTPSRWAARAEEGGGDET